LGSVQLAGFFISTYKKVELLLLGLFLIALILLTILLLLLIRTLLSALVLLVSWLLTVGVLVRWLLSGHISLLLGLKNSGFAVYSEYDVGSK